MPTFGAKYKLVVGLPLKIDDANVDQLYTIREEFTITDNQITFKLNKSNSSSANVGSITIVNAPQAMVGLLQQSQGQRSTISFKAGFESDSILSELFKGVIEGVTITDNGVDHLTKLTLSDGGSNIREFSTRRTYRKGTSIDTIIQDLIGDCKLPTGPIYKVNKEIQSSKSFSGPAHKALTSIAELYGLNYSIQDGIATLVPSLAGTSKANVIEVSTDTGMVGSPSIGSQATNLSKDGTSAKSGTKIKVLLNGDIRPENFVDVTSENVNGLYKVESVQHLGDYEGSTWFTYLTCKPTDYTIQSYDLQAPYRFSQER